MMRGHVKWAVPVGSPGRNSKCKADAQGSVLDKKNVCNISKQTVITSTGMKSSSEGTRASKTEESNIFRSGAKEKALCITF